MQVILWSFVWPNWRSHQPFSSHFVPHFRAFAYVYWNSWICRFGTWEHFTNSTVDQVHPTIHHRNHYSLTSVLAIIVNGHSTAFASLPSSAGLVETPSSVYTLFILHLCSPIQTHEIRVVYFFLQQSPLQFKVCSIFQLSIDIRKHHVIKLLLAKDCLLCSDYWTTDGLWKCPSYVSSTSGWWTWTSIVLGRRVDELSYLRL